MTKPPEDIDAILPQILADPQAVSTLQAIAERQGITTPIAELDRTQQIELVTQLISMARAAEAQAGRADALSAPSEIPDTVVVQVFSDPRADTVLREIMTSNQLTGEPADLPIDVKRAIVKLLVDQGIVAFGQP